MNESQPYAVYHANDMLEEMNLPPAMRWYTDRSRYYTHVADVVASLAQVFALTNHIDHSWTSNPEVVWHTTDRVRSTSVGDIIVSSASGRVWLVMPVGLQELTPLKGMEPVGKEQHVDSSHIGQQDWHAPFGLSQVANYEEVSRRYAAAIPDLAKEVPLPPVLPARHPVLAQLEGRYAVQDQLPPWWFGCVDALTAACPCIAPLLRSISREEFRRGSIEQRRFKPWRTAACQLAEGRKPVPCWRGRGPSLYRIMAGVLPVESRKVWLDRFVNRGGKEMPLALDLVITTDPAWWLNMGNGHGWYSCVGTGPGRDPRIVGNWYDTGVVLAALVARGADCWTLDCLIARTTVRLVVEGMTRSFVPTNTATSAQRVVLGRVYHNDLTAACNLLVSLAALFAQRGLPWGCIAGTNTAQFFQDGSLGTLAIAEDARTALGVSYRLPAATERPALEGKVAYLDLADAAAAPASGGSWTYPLFSVYASHQHNTLSSSSAQPNDNND